MMPSTPDMQTETVRGIRQAEPAVMEAEWRQEPLYFSESGDELPQAANRSSEQSGQSSVTHTAGTSQQQVRITDGRQQSGMTSSRTVRPGLPVSGQSLMGEVPLAVVRPLDTRMKPLETILGRSRMPGMATTIPAQSRWVDNQPDDLRYLAPESTPQADPAVRAAAKSSDPVEQLPEWAQRFFQQSGSTPSVMQPAVTKPVQRPAAPQQIEWTAPGVAMRPANLVYQDTSAKTQPQQQPARLSDHELRRAADKVYRMIEERLRKEMRRSGR